MAPFQLRVRTLYATRTVYALSPTRPSSYAARWRGPHSHVGTRRPLQDGDTVPPGRSSLGSLFILVLGHGLMSRGTTAALLGVDVKVISLNSPSQLRPPTLCLPSVVSGTIRSVAPQLRRTDPTLSQRVYHPNRHRPASLPLDGVTSTWVITCIAFPSSHVSATCNPFPLCPL